MNKDEESGPVRPLSQDGESGAAFAPIQSNGSQLRAPPSRGSNGSRGITRIRSQNGYSVDEEDEKKGDWTDAQGDRSPDNGQKDPFEVSWDGDENDPMCPRSYNKLRKWIIVVIVSNCSFCV